MKQYGPAIRAGERMARGRFRLVEPLGEGGMGLVWLAVDEHLSRSGEVFFVALKFLSPKIRDLPEAFDLLKREVLHSRRLNHPNITRIYDWHEHEDEPVFFSMEYVRGCSVEALRVGQPAGLFHWVAILPWVRQLCAALEYAHGTEGIVHRDLKPGNLMVTHQGVLKLADFGLADPAVARGRSGEAREGGRGTPLFSSPEQMAGAPAALTDDIYSLGATLYLLLTGTPPYRTQEEIFASPRELPQPMSDRLGELGYEVALPGHVKVTVVACLTPNPAWRLQNIREVAGRLRLHRALEPVPDQGPSLGRTTWKGGVEPEPASRNWAWLVLLVFLAGAGTAGWKWREWWKPTSRAAEKAATIATSPTNGSTHTRGRSNVIADPRTANPPQNLASLRLTRAASTRSEAITLKLLDADQKIVASNELSGLEYRFTNLKAGRYVVDAASVPDPRQRARYGVKIPRDKELALDFRPGIHRVKVLGVQKVAEEVSFTATDGWGQPLKREFKYKQFDSNDLPSQARFMTETWTNPPGEVTYRFTCPGFDPVETNCVVRPGTTDVIQVTLRPYQTPETLFNWTNSFTTAFLWVGTGTDGFWGGATEMPRRIYGEFVRQTGEPTNRPMLSVTANGWRNIGASWREPGFPQTPEHPVVGVNWSEAMQFCEWLTQHERAAGRLRTNQEYRLPTSQQWARMADSAPYPWGNGGQPVGNYADASLTEDSGWPRSWLHLSSNDGFPHTAPVDRGQTNDANFYNLGGNVAEWCLDTATNQPDMRIVRGASWADGDGEPGGLDTLRTDALLFRPIDERNDRTGFRAVIISIGRSPAEPAPATNP